jgi:hypothetical protein
MTASERSELILSTRTGQPATKLDKLEAVTVK